MDSSNTFIACILTLHCYHWLQVLQFFKNYFTEDACCCLLLLKMLISNTALPRHKDSPSCTKKSLASSTRGQHSVQLNKSWLRRWPVIQGCQSVGVIP